jgi:hypothetical protein
VSAEPDAEGGPEIGDAGAELSLSEVLAAAAEDLAMVGVTTDGERTTWLVGPVLFAAIDGDRAEFRLDPSVVRAVLRTPDTAPSARGADWVAFAPGALDDEAVDRAEAWFLSAHRRAMPVGSG